jgi:hypothetical protein
MGCSSTGRVVGVATVASGVDVEAGVSGTSLVDWGTGMLLVAVADSSCERTSFVLPER